MSTILTLSSFGVVVSLILITISFTELLPPKWSFDIPVIVLIISCIGLAVGAGIEKRQIKNNSGIYQMKQNTSKLNKETNMGNKIVTITTVSGVDIGKVVKETRDYIVLKDVISLDEKSDKMIHPFDIVIVDDIRYFKKKVETISDNISKETVALYNDLLTTFYGE